MAKQLKPSTAAGYNQSATLACERTLLTLLSAFGNMKETLRLIGGLVPRYLTPEIPPDVPTHVGTSDVDIVLNLEILATDNEYSSLAVQLKNRGFKRCINAGKSESWRWCYSDDQNIEVVVEFLRDSGDEPPGRTISIEGERVSALTIKHAGMVQDWFQEKEISAYLPDGKGLSVDIVRFADVPAFVILKAIALDQRQENKDAADLIHVIRYSGSLEKVAALFVDDEYGEGYEKVGAVCYARFYTDSDEDEDELVAKQRYASGLVQRLLAEITKQIST